MVNPVKLMIENIRKKYKKNSLFKDCIEISCPDGYGIIFDQIYNLVVEYNSQNNTNVSFGQVKIKFGRLTIYIDEPLITKGHNQKNLLELRKKIETLKNKTVNMCKVCGETLEDFVENTKLTKKCFNHFNHRQ